MKSGESRPDAAGGADKPFEEVLASKADLESVINRTPFMLTRCSRDLRYQFVSKAYAQLIGRGPEDLVGKKILEIMGEKGFETIRPHVEKVLQGERVEYESNVHFKGIGSRLLHVVYTPDLDGQGAIQGWVASIVDVSDQRRAEEALRQSELRWRTMAEALPNLLWTDLPDGQCDWLSAQWGKYTGIPEQELLGLKWIDRVIHPDDRERTLAAWKTACADKGDYDLEYRIRRYDGKYRWFKTRGVPIRDDCGRIVYWFGTCTDIDDLRQAEAARAQLSAIVESSADAIYTYDFDGTILTWNRSAEQLYGYAADEIIGGSIEAIVPPELKSEAEDTIIAAIKAGQSIANLATLRKRRDGTIFNALLTASPICDAAGKPSAVSIIVRDVTAQKAVEAKLRESEATFRAMFSISSVGKLQADAETGRFLRANAAMSELTGYSEAELLARSFADITHHDNWMRDRQELRRLVSGEADKFDTETRYVRKDGSSVWVRATINLISSQDGRPLRTTAIIQDITDRKRAEEQAHVLMREVNHRAKNMLAVVQAIARQTASDDAREFVSRFGERLHALAASQDLLVKSGWKDIPLDALVRAQLAHFAELLDTRILIGGPNVKVTAAAAQAIGMALHELATNASKYGALSSATGTVEINWSVDQHRFALSWTEMGGPPVTRPARRGFGSTVLDTLARLNLNADVELDYAKTGLIWRLNCPIHQVVEAGGATINAAHSIGI